MPPVGFEPTISAGEQPQTCALDRAATGTGQFYDMPNVNSIIGAASCYGLDGRTSRGAEIPLTFPGRPESHPSLLYSRYGVCFVERKTAGLWP